MEYLSGMTKLKIVIFRNVLLLNPTTAFNKEWSPVFKESTGIRDYGYRWR